MMFMKLGFVVMISNVGNSVRIMIIVICMVSLFMCFFSCVWWFFCRWLLNCCSGFCIVLLK